VSCCDETSGFAGDQVRCLEFVLRSQYQVTLVQNGVHFEYIHIYLYTVERDSEVQCLDIFPEFSSRMTLYGTLCSELTLEKHFYRPVVPSVFGVVCVGVFLSHHVAVFRVRFHRNLAANCRQTRHGSGMNVRDDSAQDYWRKFSKVRSLLN